MKNHVSSKAETLPMFRSKFLDFFSRVHWTVPLVIYLPSAIALFAVPLVVYHTSPVTAVGLFIGGLFIWTFAEYALHRFVFHYHPRSRLGKRFFWIMHGVHHEYPSDPLRLVMPPIVSIPLACLFYALFYSILGTIDTLSFMSGFIIGYLYYDMCHYAIHHFPAKGVLWNKVKKHHMRHHFNNPEGDFGVTSPLWDLVFKTMFIKKLKPSAQQHKNTKPLSEEPKEATYI